MVFTVPGYQIDQLIGYGSHAEVWSARLAATAEPVALKRIILHPAGTGGDQEARQAAALVRSARTEAALLAALEHPSLIRLRQYVQTPAAVVLVMELAEGGSLAQLLRRRDRLTPAEVAAALSPIAAALAYAHDEGVLHGDVSAANILFTATGQPKLADLGVARMLIGQANAERALGTPAYVDPVLAAGGAAGPASDVFSLAAVALHCLSGAGPWQSGDSGNPADFRTALARAATGVIDDLPGRLAGCPEPMAAVLTRALDPEPHRRGLAAEFALDLGASVRPAPVVLAAGRIMPEVGRHSVDRQQAEAEGAFAIPSDLTHVSRPQLRPEPVERAPSGRLRTGGLRTRHRVVSALAGRLSTARRGERPAAVTSAGPVVIGDDLPGGLRRPRRLPLSAVFGLVAVLLGGGLAGFLIGGWPRAGQAATASPVPTTRVAPSPAIAKRAAADPAADPAAVLRRLADRRAEAFALNRPELLSAVYSAPALLNQDASQLTRRVPAGCGLVGLRTSYRDVTLVAAGRAAAAPERLELRATASQPAASLICAGVNRGQTLPAAQVRLRLSLVKAGGDFRIASQRPEGR
jgi:eukaryotic-like serine/threonine-protein kinase